MSEARASARIVNTTGLHARPCHQVVSAALEYDCELRIMCGSREVNGRSILELMTLQAGPDAVLEFRAQGREAQQLVERLVTLVEAGFEERD